MIVITRRFSTVARDLVGAVLVAGATGLIVLVQRLLVFGALEPVDENTFAQAMAAWGLIAVLFGRIQHRAMADAVVGSRKGSYGRQELTAAEAISLAIGAIAVPCAWFVPSAHVSLGLSALAYAASLPTLLGLIGRAYGHGSAAGAQTATLVVAVVQLSGLVFLVLVGEATLSRITAMLALAVVSATLLLRLSFRRLPPIDWHSVLRPFPHLFLGSLALACSWAASHGDVFALAFSPDGSRFSKLGAAISLGKTGIFAALPIIPFLAKCANAGQLSHNLWVLLATLFGAVIASGLTIEGANILGVLSDSLLDEDRGLLALIALCQVPSVMILIFSYSIAMHLKLRPFSLLGPLSSLVATVSVIPQVSDNPATGLMFSGLFQTALAVFLSRCTEQGSDVPPRDLLGP